MPQFLIRLKSIFVPWSGLINHNQFRVRVFLVSVFHPQCSKNLYFHFDCYSEIWLYIFFRYLILVVGDEGDVDHLLLADAADEAVGVEGGAVDAHAVPVHRAPAARAVVAPLLVTLLAKHLKSNQIKLY